MLIPDLYLYSIKIPTDINQNTVIKLQQNHIYFFIIFKKFYNNFFSYIYIYIIQNNIYNNIKSGWAGPNHWAGLSPKPRWAEVGPKMYWADLGPKMYWTDLGPKKCTGPISAQKCTGPILAQNKFSSGPEPAQKTGLGQDPPDPATKRARGINFPPPLHAERYSFCMQRRK
jgi:hypothetical protein